MKRIGFPAAAAVLALLILARPTGVTTAPAEAATRSVVSSPFFNIRNLGAFPGDFSGSAQGLNNWGDAVGFSQTFDLADGMPQRATLFANRQVLRFHSMPAETPGLDRGVALAVNDQGVAVGYAYGFKGPFHAARFAPSATSDLGILPGGSDSYATAINNPGEIVGYGDTAPGENGSATHAIRFAGGAAIDLGVLIPGGSSYATGINDRGIIVGYASAPLGNTHAVSFVDGKVVDFGPPPGGFNSAAAGINNQGQAVGWADFGDGPIHAALFANGAITDLGTLPGGRSSAAAAINNLGQAVGWSDDGTGIARPVLFVAGRVIDLGTFAGVTNCYPSAINDRGQVVGTVELLNPPDIDLPRTLAVLWTPAAQAVLPAQITRIR